MKHLLKFQYLTNQNLTRRVIKARSMTYKRPPVMSVDSGMEDYVNVHDLNGKRRQLESLTYLLDVWLFVLDGMKLQIKVEYENLTHFEPLFLPYEDKPLSIAYFVQYGYSSDESQDMMAVWTEDRPGYEGVCDWHHRREESIFLADVATKSV